MGWLARRLGHRGAWLIILGAIWALFGVGVLIAPEPHIPWVLHQVIPIQVRAAGWVISGTIAVLTGARGRGVSDTAGHVALWVMPALRFVSYAASWALYALTTILTDRSVGYDHGWYAAAVWALVIVMLHLVAGWPNPTLPLPTPPERPQFGNEHTGGDDREGEQ